MRRAVPSIVVAGLLATGCGAMTPAASDFVEVPGLGPTRIDVPRPSGLGGDDCALRLDPVASLEERASGLRDAGLFADRSALTDAELAAELEAALHDEWGGSLTPSDPRLRARVGLRVVGLGGRSRDRLLRARRPAAGPRSRLHRGLDRPHGT